MLLKAFGNNLTLRLCLCVYCINTSSWKEKNSNIQMFSLCCAKNVIVYLQTFRYLVVSQTKYEKFSTFYAHFLASSRSSLCYIFQLYFLNNLFPLLYVFMISFSDVHSSYRTYNRISLDKLNEHFRRQTNLLKAVSEKILSFWIGLSPLKYLVQIMHEIMWK